MGIYTCDVQLSNKKKKCIYVADVKRHCPLSLAAGGGEILSRGSYPFGTDSVPIWLDNLSCSGTETSLFDCPANDIGDSNCNHNEDVGVQCTGGG
jgi:hypothetical protein